MAQLAQVVASGSGGSATLSAALLGRVCIKAGIFPSISGCQRAISPPASVSAIFSGLLTKVWGLCVDTVFTLIFVEDVAFTHGLSWG